MQSLSLPNWITTVPVSQVQFLAASTPQMTLHGFVLARADRVSSEKKL
jgi:hypothetical protein